MMMRCIKSVLTHEIIKKEKEEMKKFKCEEIMCNNCVSRIDKALTAAEIWHQVDLETKTVTIEGCEPCETKAVEILDDLGFSAVEV